MYVCIYVPYRIDRDFSREGWRKTPEGLVVRGPAVRLGEYTVESQKATN